MQEIKQIFGIFWAAISDLIFDREKKAKKKNIQRIKSHEKRKIDNPHLSMPSRIFNRL